MADHKRKLAVIDLETDPFQHGEMVHPFVAGFYDGSNTKIIWSDDCVDESVDYLKAASESYCIYAHNGGRFDFFYYLPYFSSETRIINGRIVKAFMGRHEFRDSFAIMPFKLEYYDKDKIDYEKFRKSSRNNHREEIVKYLKKDLTALYELVTAFHQEFGDRLTIGSAAMHEIKQRHKFACGKEDYDAKFRTKYYFGGRNQVFESGIIHGDIRVYDVNSMYPFVMSSYLHPLGTRHAVSRTIDRKSCFVVVEGKNYGAFPVRQKDNSLDFTVPHGTFYTSIHEFNAAVETGAFKCTRVVKSYVWTDLGCFDEFVNHFYDARRKAKETGDKIKTIFYKFVLNSGYGKFAQNPDNYFDWYITEYGEVPPDFHVCEKGCETECRKRWLPAYVHEGTYMIWKRPLQTKFWYNIAIGASITGAARAHLLRGIRATRKPLYVDTDSIIACGDSCLEMDDYRLGAWKLEAVGRMAAIGGKKMYAIFDAQGKCIKKAHKGVKLTGEEIKRIAEGEVIDTANPVPSFKWDGSWKFTSRKVRSTAA